MSEQAQFGRKRNPRPTIGLVSFPWDQQGGGPAFEVWQGMYAAVQNLDLNLLCFAGGAPQQWGQSRDQRRILSELAVPEHLDGLVTFDWWTDRDTFERFYENFRPLPVVNVMRFFEGYPGVAMDNHRDMLTLMSHLIETHGYRRIAYTHGWADGPAQAERFQAYQDALGKYGILVDPALILQRDYPGPGGQGERLVRYLMDDQKFRPGVDFDAVMGYNDDQAVQAMRALQARSVRVPYEVAIAGIDDLPSSRIGTPPLTTLAMPRYEMGYKAVELLLAQIQGQEVPEQTVIPARLILRQSCGCMPTYIRDAGAIPERVGARAAGQSFDEAWAVRRGEILGEMAQAVETESLPAVDGWAEQVLDTFHGEVTGTPSGSLITLLDDLLRPAVQNCQRLTPWQNVLSVLRRHLLVCLSDADNKILYRAEALLGQGRAFLHEMERLAQAQRRTHVSQQAERLRNVSQAFMTAPDLDTLIDQVAQRLPEFGINQCYLSIYQDTNTPQAQSRLLLAYDGDHRFELRQDKSSPQSVGTEQDRLCFPTPQLMPAEFWPTDHRYALDVEPLYVQQAHVGFAVFGMGETDGAVYEALRAQLSSALRGILAQQALQSAYQETEHRALQLETVTELSTVVTSLVDLDALIQQAVNLAQTRLGLYYVGLFLIDRTGALTGEAGKWAVLRAGTGEAGKKMVEIGHKLAVADTSMIGRCIVTGRADIQQRVSEADVRFANPLLPDTRSEMALPLITRGEVIGALTIQSAQEAAFTPETIYVFQSMANQVANAIANARLVETVQTRLHEMEVLEQVGTAVSSMFDLDYTLDATVRALADEMAFTYIAINLIDRAANEMRTPRGFGLAAPLGGMVRSLDGMQNDILMDIARKQEIEVIDGWDDRFDREIWERAGHQNLVRGYVPLVMRGESVGILEVGYDRRERPTITPEEVRLLRSIANRIAVAVENARLLEETRAYAAQQGAIADISSRMQQATDMESLMQVTVQELHRALGASRVYVRLGTPESWKE